MTSESCREERWQSPIALSLSPKYLGLCSSIGFISRASSRAIPLNYVNQFVVHQGLLGETQDWQGLQEEVLEMKTLQIERRLSGGSWALHCAGQRFQDADEAWELVYGIMAWRPEIQLRLCAFHTDPYEATAKYLYPNRAQSETEMQSP